MKSLISSAKKYHSTVECTSEDMNLKNERQKKKWRETDRQIDRETETERERIHFQIKKKKIQSSSPSLSLQIYLGHKKEYKVYTGRRIKHI